MMLLYKHLFFFFKAIDGFLSAKLCVTQKTHTHLVGLCDFHNFFYSFNLKEKDIFDMSRLTPVVGWLLKK